MKHTIVKRLALGFGALVVALPSMSGIAAAQTTSSTSGQPGKYVALGDSVAAGAGLPSSPNSGDVPCQRSAQAYAYKVAEATGKQLRHVACGGASTDNLYGPQTVGSNIFGAQLGAAFSGGNPDLMTFTIGANDMRWSDFLKLCLSSQNCDTPQNSYAVDALLANLRHKLAFSVGSISYYSHGKPPKVILTGYYNPVSPTCSMAIPTLSASEVGWITTQINKLNTTLQTVSGWFPYATYAPADFTGHDICSASPWVQGIGAPAPFHPTADGQQAIAAAVIQKL